MLTRSFSRGPGLISADRRERAYLVEDDRAPGYGPAVTHYATVLIKAAGEGPFLLQERPRAEGVEYKGRFSMFGGRRESSESPEGTAIREVLEETGLHLKTDDLTFLAQVESRNETGSVTRGALFLANNIPFETLKSLDILDGAGVFLKRSDVPRQWGRLTSITHFAIAAFEEIELARQNATPGGRRGGAASGGGLLSGSFFKRSR